MQHERSVRRPNANWFYRSTAICAVLLICVAQGARGDRAMADADKPKSEKSDKAEKSQKDVTITVLHKKTELRLCKGEGLELKLEMRAGTGFTWEIAKNDSAILESRGKPGTEPIGEVKPGSAQLQVFRFVAKSAGTSDLELEYKRPFEKDTPPARTYKLSVVVVETSGGK